MPQRAPFESKTHPIISRILLNFFLAIVIFYHAELGRLLGIQALPLSISVVWPATGISLAALLLFGLNLWPGVFFGNLAYNVLHLYLNGASPVAPIIVGIVISAGSLLQAYVGYSLIRRYSSVGYLNTVNDVIIFLIPAGLLSCLIAPTIGSTALLLYGAFTTASFFNVWLTFWVGDTMGVYVFTPLLVVWSISKPLENLKAYWYEAIWIVAGFTLITLLTFVLNYPVRQFYVILSVWAAFRFGMHGATLFSLLVTLALIIPTSLGYGQFSTIFLTSTLLILVSFIEIIVATTLFLAALVKEREEAWHKLLGDNVDMKQVIEDQRHELKLMDDEKLMKDKLSALGLMTAAISKQLHVPLRRISNAIQKSLDAINQVKRLFLDSKDRMDTVLATGLEHALQNVETGLTDVAKSEREASEIAKMMEDQAQFTAPGKIKFNTLEINLFLNKCLVRATEEYAKEYPNFIFTVIENFDKNMKITLPIVDDLVQAFFNLFKNSIASMKKKKDRLVEGYTPILRLKTVNSHHQVEIEIMDNGEGVDENRLKNFSSSFLGFDSAALEEEGNLSLALAHDIIIHVYRGTIKVSSQVGEYSKLTVTLPKS